MCPPLPDPFTTGELHEAVKVTKDNLHVLQANIIMDNSLTHKGINNIGVMLDKQNSRADTFFDKLQEDHIDVFDKLQDDHANIFGKLQEDHSQVFDKLQEDHSDVFQKLQEDHSTMLGKLQKDHLQMITQLWEYQVKNEVVQQSMNVKLMEVDTKLDAIMSKLLTVAEIQQENEAFEDLLDSSPSDVLEDAPEMETETEEISSRAPRSIANQTEMASNHLATPTPTSSPTTSESPTASPIPTWSPSSSPTGSPSASPSELPSSTIPIVPVPDIETLKSLVGEYFSTDWKESSDAVTYG